MEPSENCEFCGAPETEPINLENTVWECFGCGAIFPKIQYTEPEDLEEYFDEDEFDMSDFDDDIPY